MTVALTSGKTRFFSDSESAFAAKVIARLSDTDDELPHEILEKLKVARARAVSARKITSEAPVFQRRFANKLAYAEGHNDNDPNTFLGWLGSVLPLIVLLLGLITIHVVQTEMRANEIAEIDAELLTDDLPPLAYTDPGFSQFLHVTHGQ